MTQRLTATLVIGAVFAFVTGCGGSAPAPEAPAAPAPPPTEAPTAEAPVAEPPAEEPPAPAPAKQVNLDSIEVEGGGIEKADVEKALEGVQAAYEKCYADALSAEPDAAGKVSVTYLYMKGQRKSVSASYSGRGSKLINSCFQEAAASMTLAPSAEAERTVIFVRFKLAKAQ